MGQFASGGGVVFRRSTLTPRQSQFLFSRRPRSWPSTSESTIACKRRKQAPREYEDLQYERLTRASSSNNSKLMCIESEVNADHGNKQAVKGQTFGFLQWSKRLFASITKNLKITRINFSVDISFGFCIQPVFLNQMFYQFRYHTQNFAST